MWTATNNPGSIKNKKPYKKNIKKMSKIEKTSCSSSGALRWGLSDGKLSIDNGRMCLVRLADNTGAMAKCSDANEYISMDIPTVYSSEDLAAMLNNQVLN